MPAKWGLKERVKTGKPFRGQLQNLKKKRLYFFESVVAMRVVRSGHFKPIGFMTY